MYRPGLDEDLSCNGISRIKSWPLFVFVLDSSGAGTGIFWVNEANTMAAEVLAPCIARSLVAMVFNMWDRQIFVFHEEGF